MNRKVKWELRHDLLAPRIWAKLPEQDRTLRQVRSSLSQRQADYAANKGSLLGEKELEAWRAYRGKLELPEELDRYFEESEVALRKVKVLKQRRQRQFIASVLLVAAIAVAAAFVSNYYRLESEKALAETTASLLREAETHIYTLNYDKAQVALLSAGKLGVEPQKIATALMEPAYFRIETHNFQEGWQLVQEVARLYNEPPLTSQIAAGDSLKMLRSALMGLGRERYKTLGFRYYPVMIPVEGGTFIMGCNPKKERGCISDSPLHPATVSDYEIASTETTLWQFSIYCAAEGKNINHYLNALWPIAGDRPVIIVDWYEALEYANWVSKQQGKAPIYTIDTVNKDPLNLGDDWDKKRWAITANWSANGYRLPTETEWEYAARGGQQSKNYRYSGSNEIDEVAWYSGNAHSRSQPVSQKKANELGLFDMSGNMQEWCWDWYRDYSIQPPPPSDYSGPGSGENRVLRGGSWLDNATYARVSFRNGGFPNHPVRSSNYGFRLARAH